MVSPIDHDFEGSANDKDDFTDVSKRAMKNQMQMEDKNREKQGKLMVIKNNNLPEGIQ
ncbi:hypothetical protein HPP92_028908 [Vanilla planifolia]|uniref:Uncharacterized protein n=1 Tax=Vanilla planifolia TaxID=51239 RepID=A0A835P6A8_VANPL|nr:hypothetical protein HPP92_028908 [Vanilla planifolia]KAG0446311.1 hypothetical protein HPP92_028898 [Vanilla planifolia]